VVPTRNEQDGVGILLERLAESLTDVRAEVLFVDDSNDDTPDAIRAAARRIGLPVRLLHRTAGSRRGGLAGAVVAGLKAARGSWAVVMDGDLQHPPELVSRLVSIGESRRFDLVAGTRYDGPGDSQGLAGGYRKAVSGLANRLTKAMFPRRLARLSDPMSGFFAVRLSALDLTTLNPTGIVINTAVLWLFSDGGHTQGHYLLAAVVATEASTTWNFVFTEWLVFRGPKPGSRFGRGFRFYLLNHLALLPRLPLLALLVEVFQANLLVANLITLMLLFLVRFVIADSAIYAMPDDLPEIEKQPMRLSFDLTGIQARPALESADDQAPRPMPRKQQPRPL